MSFDSFSDLLAMGGHGLYVWMSYGASLLVIGWNLLRIGSERRRFFREAKALQRRRSAAGSEASAAAGADGQPGV